jgi:hypothetical protein
MPAQRESLLYALYVTDYSVCYVRDVYNIFHTNKSIFKISILSVM